MEEAARMMVEIGGSSERPGRWWSVTLQPAMTART